MIDIAAVLRDAIHSAEMETSGGHPIFHASTPQEASIAVRTANEHGFRICPCGKLSRTRLDSLPTPTLLLSSARMNRLIELAADDLFVTVGAGATFADVAAFLGDSNLGMRPEFAAYSGTIGAACSLGVSFGSHGNSFHIRQIVPSIEFVTPTGGILRSGAVTIKSVAGYDVARFLCGARGVFGFITAVTFHLKPVRRGNMHTSSGLNIPERVTPDWSDRFPSDSALKRLKQSLDPRGIFPTAVAVAPHTG